MESGTERKRQQSITYILRRRNRSRKIGANSNTPIKSWAEYSDVNFKPSGSNSPIARWLLLPLGFVLAISPLLMMIGADGAEDAGLTELPQLGWSMLMILAVLSLVIALFFLAYAGLSIWRIVQANQTHKNE